MNIFFIIIILILLLLNNSLQRQSNKYFENFYQKKCCNIKTAYVKDPSNKPAGGNFKYIFDVSDNCDYNTFVDGLNGWSNTNCNENNNILGSCRISNKECVDYVTKDYCDNYKNMFWSNNTCRNNIFPAGQLI